MKPSIQKLQKFFKLEADRDYDNKAVMGGLEGMLEPWQAEALAEGLPQELIEAVVARLRDYPRLSPESRAEALKGLWKRIQKTVKGAEPAEASEGAEPVEAPPSQKEDPTPAEADEPAAPPEGAEPAEAPPSQKEDPTPAEAPKGAEPAEALGEGAEPAEAPPSQKEDPTPAEAPEGAELAEASEAPPSAQEKKPPAKPASSKKPDGPPAALDAEVTVLNGVGSGNAQKLSKLGMETLGDMLYHFPRRYDDYSQLKPINRLDFGEELTIIGMVESIATRPIRGGKMKLTEAVISDGSGSLRVSWFNQPWLENQLRKDTQVVLSGKVEQYLGRLTMNNPGWEQLDTKHLHTNRIVPVYPLTAKITQRWLRRMMHEVVSYWSPRVEDPLPKITRNSADLMPLSNALMQAHFPSSDVRLKAARFRLAFDEIFLLQLGVLRQRHHWKERTARVFEAPQYWLDTQMARLPFTLTTAQHRALADLSADLSSGHPMNRLLQGDVGSGKTVIAALGIALIAHNSAQSALMAPTSILAEQHYQSLLKIMSGETSPITPEQIRLLIGATPETEKAEIRAGLENGDIKLVIGTHALIEDPVIFQDLQLIIIDEQHRFGVDQRAKLRAKGENPHLLVMTATPIPRSLALTVYGDLDLSIMDEMPPGRQETATHILFPRERERAYTLVNKHLAEGRQAFIIYPLVEESEKTEAKAAVEEHQRLSQEIFPHHRLGLLHGRLKPDEKAETMSRFRNGEYDILVSTSVVEVGVDVPNATVMVIEGANRFGLAQLHQFRGRVGRGEHKSICLLIPQSDDQAENERLSTMAETNDGFVLAERDLEQRGPGQFLGARQSGYAELSMAQLTDIRLIELARREAKALFKNDPQLEKPQHQLLSAALERFWGRGDGDIS